MRAFLNCVFHFVILYVFYVLHNIFLLFPHNEVGGGVYIFSESPTLTLWIRFYLNKYVQLCSIIISRVILIITSSIIKGGWSWSWSPHRGFCSNKSPPATLHSIGNWILFQKSNCSWTFARQNHRSWDENDKDRSEQQQTKWRLPFAEPGQLLWGKFHQGRGGGQFFSLVGPNEKLAAKHNCLICLTNLACQLLNRFHSFHLESVFAATLNIFLSSGWIFFLLNANNFKVKLLYNLNYMRFQASWYLNRLCNRCISEL